MKRPDFNQMGWVLRGIDLNLDEGERLALVGESGCGKSMMALSVLHLLPQPPMEQTEGEIWFKGRELGGVPDKEWRKIRGKEIGIVFQEPFTSLNPVMPVGEQIEETIQTHMEIGKKKALEKVYSLFKDVGLSDPFRIFRQYPHQLSGGMCQRVMIAMAISCEPSLLIADEPTTALDVTVQMQILELLFRMTDQFRLAVIFITHDLRIVQGHADRVAILYAGQVVEEGNPVKIFRHPLHPYTEGLLSALPKFSQKGKNLFSIPGSVLSPFSPLEGCVFADRCPRVRDKCRSQKPVLNESKKGHRVRCFYPSEK